VAENVRADDKGTFRANFAVRELPGHYKVTASQVSATKAKIEDGRFLIVPVIDKGRRE
jgi:hypothetical protein